MKRKKILLGAALILAAAVLLTAALFYTGVWQINHPSPERYPVRGVDVSAYQGEIDWPVLAGQSIRFAYIKATEGSSMVDARFDYNWAEAHKTGLRVGAYHFFSFETSGQAQADQYIRTVTATGQMLPPAVDVEPYGAYDTLSADVLAELAVWLERVEQQYAVRPILYTTREFYDRVRNAFPQHDIWLRSVYGTPPEQSAWTFWQYSNRMRLDGYTGEERFIDMNVFAGTEEDFDHYGR